MEKFKKLYKREQRLNEECKEIDSMIEKLERKKEKLEHLLNNGKEEDLTISRKGNIETMG